MKSALKVTGNERTEGKSLEKKSTKLMINKMAL
jgi:hypothetical protein